MTSSTELSRQLLVDGFSRINDGVPAVLGGLSADDLLWRPDFESNHVAWLVWHLSRQQDAQVAGLGDHDQAWTSGGFADRFDLPYDRDEHGYGMSPVDVGAFPSTDPQLFIDYQQAVFDLTSTFLSGLSAEDYTEVIDESWDPPVTLASRVISVLDDAAKHLGQAEYLKGLAQRRS